MTTVIGQKAFDLIIAEEVTSKAYYVKHYMHPEWPGVKSGITIGIGYDLGYASPAKIRGDWAKHVTSDMLLVMLRCSGITGNAAKNLLSDVQSLIEISWEAALQVFAVRDIPTWTALVIRKIKGADRLSPTCLGVLVSLAYNRGASFDQVGERYMEMRAIKLHIEADQLDRVAGQIRSMKRLWPNVAGLRARRDREAALWEWGLKNIEMPAGAVRPAPVVPDPEVPTNEGAARTKPPATSTAQNTSTGAIVVGGTTGAVVAHQVGFISTELALFIAFVAVLGGVSAWLIWYRRRNPK